MAKALKGPYYIVDRDSAQIKARFATERGAKISLTRVWSKKSPDSDLEVMHHSVYDIGFRRKVTVVNLMSKEPVEIDVNDRGGPCDPSTERYWAM